MTEICIPVDALHIEINIVPFGTFNLIDTSSSDYQPKNESVEYNQEFEFPSTSVVCGSVVYEDLVLFPKPL